jgi:hypothetical protein
MKCSDVDRILPDIVDGVLIEEGRDVEVQSHLRTCRECSELVSDLKLIASEARQLADSEEPSARVWVNIANELRAEGLIRETEFEMARPVLVPGRQRRWNPFWLAPVAAAVLVAGSYLVVHHPSHHATAQVVNSPAVQQTVVRQAEPQVAQQAPLQQRLTPGKTTEVAQSAIAAPPNLAAKTRTDAAPGLQADQTSPDDTTEAELSPQASDNEFLSEVSERAPSMRSTYEDQLKAVNNEIRETKAYISRNPGDIDARQHLLEVYQQKALLYQMALDRIQ